MKRVVLALLLLGLVLLELWILESFLPFGWRHPVSELFERVFPGQPYAPHPRMDLEIEMVLRQHLSWRIGSYLVTAALAIGNAFAILKVGKAFRRSASQ